jgi:hypothetical protein
MLNFVTISVRNSDEHLNGKEVMYTMGVDDSTMSRTCESGGHQKTTALRLTQFYIPLLSLVNF